MQLCGKGWGKGRRQKTASIAVPVKARQEEPISLRWVAAGRRSGLDEASLNGRIGSSHLDPLPNTTEAVYANYTIASSSRGPQNLSASSLFEDCRKPFAASVFAGNTWQSGAEFGVYFILEF